MDLLQINWHVRNNHNPMLVERMIHYLNKGLKIMMNKQDLVWVAMEAILLLLYAWNSTLIPCTHLSHCFVALCQEFWFLINFATNKHFELMSTPSTNQFEFPRFGHLPVCSLQGRWAFGKEQCAYHRKFVNSQLPVYFFPGHPSEYFLLQRVANFATHVTFYFYYFCTQQGKKVSILCYHY